MTAEYELATSSIEVPKNTGLEGFVHTVRSILKLPKVQSITISAKGKITYERYVLDGEPKTLSIDFNGIEPYHLIRNAPKQIEELVVHSGNAATILAAMLDRASSEQLFPIAFVTGANTVLWRWYQQTTGFSLVSKESISGLPVLFDRYVPDTALILSATLAKDGTMIDTYKSYKVEMDFLLAPQTHVEVF